MISGIFIVLMMIAFFAIVFWAYSDKQKKQFEHMSNLPLEHNSSSIKDKGDENGND